VLKTSTDPVDVIEKEEQDRALRHVRESPILGGGTCEGGGGREQGAYLNAGNISHDALEIVEDRNCGRGTRVEAS
jgi:hypothetical protein